MSKTYVDGHVFQNVREKAFANAQERLNKEGIKFPIFVSSHGSTDEYIKKLDEYREIESQYYVEALRGISNTVNVVAQSPKPQQKPFTKQWARPYSDD